MLTTLSYDIQVFSRVENFVSYSLQEYWNSFVTDCVMQLPVSTQNMVKKSTDTTQCTGLSPEHQVRNGNQLIPHDVLDCYQNTNSV